MKKRIISLMLAFCMLTGLLPAIHAEDASAAESAGIEYVFSAAAKNSTASIDGNANVIAAATMAEGYEKWSVESLSWIYKSWIHASRSCIQAYAFEGVVEGTKGKESLCGNTFAIAIVLNITETGTFIPKLTYLETYFSPICNIYLVKKNEGDDTSDTVTQKSNEALKSYIAENCNEDNFLGSVDMYRAGTKPDDGIEGADDLKAVNITESGEYYLIIERAGLNPDFGNYTVQSTYYASYIFLKKFSLSDAYIRLASDKTELIEEETLDISASLIGAGTDEAINGAEITYESSAENVLSVSENGVVSALAPGAATVTVTAVANNKKYTKSIAFSVKEHIPTADEYDLTTKLSDTEIGIGEKVSILETTAEFRGEAIDLTGATVSYSLSEKSRNILSPEADGKTFTAIADGTAEIITRVEKDGFSNEIISTVTVDDSKRITAVYLYAGSTLKQGKQLEYTIMAEQKNQKRTYDCPLVRFEIVEQSEEGVLLLKDNDAVAEAGKAGSARIKAYVLVHGVVYETDTVEVTVTEEAADGIVEFVFTTTAKNLEDQTDGSALINLTDMADGYDRWHIEGLSWVYKPMLKDTNLQWYALENNLKDSDGEYINSVAAAIVLKIEETGTFVPTLTYYKNYCSSVNDIYLIKKNEADSTYQEDYSKANSSLEKYIDENCTAEAYLGTIDGYASGKTEVSEDFKAVNITEPGEYYLIFVDAGRNESFEAYETKTNGDAVYTYVNKFTLTDENAIHSAGITVGNENCIAAGETEQARLSIYTRSGDETFPGDVKTVWNTDDASVAEISDDGVVTGVNEGTATITAIVTAGGKMLSATAVVRVEDTSGIAENGISISAPESVYIYGKAPLRAYAKMNSGREIEIPAEYVEWEILSGSDEGAFEISEDDTITGIKLGEAKLQPKISADFKDGADKIAIAPVTVEIVWDTTVDPVIYTVEERENAKNNAKKYSWAKSEVKKAVEKADSYLPKLDLLINLATPEGLFRFYYAGHKYDPNKGVCRYCKADIEFNYGAYGWSTDALNRPWKIQCPDCKRVFPSNDFGSFYELGLSDNKAVWSYETALQKHHEKFVCEHVKNGKECTHTPPAESAPAPDSSEWMSNDPRNDAWYEYYGYGVKGGYLNNDLYAEMDEKLGVKAWCVDDGMGYLQPYISDPSLPGYDSRYSDKNGYAYFKDGSKSGKVFFCPIAVFLHEGVWYGQGSSGSASVKLALEAFQDAFLYTGDAKYGRAGARLLDRIADVHPGMNWYRWHNMRSDSYRGGIVDPIWSCNLVRRYAAAYDAFKPVYNDPELVKILSNSPVYEADENGNRVRDENGELIPVNLKDSPGALRKNVEDNILLDAFARIKTGRLMGNFGTHQYMLATCALALNRLPETGEMLDWIMRTGEGYNTGGDNQPEIEGGSVAQRLVSEVDRDGNGTENAPGYNRLWLNRIINLSDVLSGYELYSTADLFRHVKFRNMLLGQIRLTLGGYYGAQTGDSGGYASKGIVADADTLLIAFKHTGIPELAQAIYMLNGDSAEGIAGSIFDEDPEGLREKILEIVEEKGTLTLGSDNMTGYGFAALRAGANHTSVSEQTASNTHRDFAIYYGSGSGHGHKDGLNLYMSAFGLNFAPDLGYPEQTGTQPNRNEWIESTLSHNTVVVDELTQSPNKETGTPYHFDDAGRVKLMDASADVYKQTEDYRRSVIMVEVDDEISYGVDFFHVKGGNDHLYSFHSQSDELTEVSGLSGKVTQPMYTDSDGNKYGTYAGADVKYGPDPTGVSNLTYPSGYTWMYNVRTFNEIKKDFTVEFKVKDRKKALKTSRDLRLRLTMVNDESPAEVSFTTALPPQKPENVGVGGVDYLLVRNKGENLDTTFTTVFEPYEAGNKYISSIEKVPMVRAEGAKPSLTDSFSAVKVTLENGRVDYIIYSTNNTVDYVVDGKINFRGFAGVISLEGGGEEEAVVYKYLNDGEILSLIGEDAEAHTAAYTGTVSDFTDDLLMENYITFTPDAGQSVSAEALSGKYVYIENDGVRNGAYKIESARTLENGDVELYIGNVSPVRCYVDDYDFSLGYVFNIARGQKLRIPLTTVTDGAPVFEQPGDFTTSAGSSITIPLNAVSSNGKKITLSGTTLPRGMSINEDAMTLTWKPDSSQIGENHVAVTASDGTLNTTVHFTVTVYGSTTGGSSSGESTSAGASGGGGGGAAPDKGDSSGSTDDTAKSEETDNVETAPDVSGETEKLRFTDLGNHEWAAGAIEALAAGNIIKGTTHDKYSPQNNIIRADFALLLVRAFNLESDNTENFADVRSDDYFASELAIARNTGIVQGIGDNKYAPRKTITRQDMMVITYRALQALGTGETLSSESQASLPEEALAANYADWENVASYAREAVASLIGAGLVNGKNGRIAPTDYTTRAEVAVLIKRILDYTKK